VAEFTINIQNGHPQPQCTLWHARESVRPGRGPAVAVYNIGYPGLQRPTLSSNNIETFNTAAPMHRMLQRTIIRAEVKACYVLSHCVTSRRVTISNYLHQHASIIAYASKSKVVWWSITMNTPIDLFIASDIKKGKFLLSCSHQKQLGTVIEPSPF
jgi:hypothetical protein